MLDRAAIFQALAARLTDAVGFTVEAPPIGFQVPPATEQPKGFVLPFEENPEQSVGLPPVHHLYPELRFYLRFDEQATDPAPGMNALIGEVDQALQATLTERAVPGGENVFATTLGGLVFYCWRERTVIEPGQLGRQAVLAMVLHAMAPEP